ncbi:hypothetical protein [Campylobacter upsaliensis]|uniref:hypothetical protein n=1 Tax=Campylobacter upsaliensis TaxID=28080 RepID=UPI0022EA98F3|nr:hypothetical protein [Campylobacter upsaliensis]
MINKNKLFRQIHIYTSLFFLPCAVLFAFTGMAYIFGFNQDVGLKTQNYILQKSIEVGKEREALLEFLKENNLKIPSNTELRVGKGKGNGNSANVMLMGGTHYSVEMKPVANHYEITLKTRSILGDMIMLHKDKAAWYFSVLSVGFGVVLFLLYLSGLMITFFASKKDRAKQLTTFAIGLLVTILLAYLSL